MAEKKPMGIVHLHTLPEDERITAMTDFVRRTGKTCLVATDSTAGKAERYIRKFRQHHPDIAILDDEPVAGPTKGVRSFKIGPQ